MYIYSIIHFLLINSKLLNKYYMKLDKTNFILSPAFTIVSDYFLTGYYTLL